MDIRAIDLCKAFNGHIVFNNLTVAFPYGKRTVIMGDSGCGKTTLLRILMKLETPDSGYVTGIPEPIGAVFQEDRLLEKFNVISNIAFAADKGISKAVILRHLSEIGLRDNARQSVSELSGGMRRRVAITRAILARKELLLLDEPLKGLDEQNRERTAAYIKRYSEDITTIIVTHDLGDVSLFAAELVRMETQT